MLGDFTYDVYIYCVCCLTRPNMFIKKKPCKNVYKASLKQLYFKQSTCSTSRRIISSLLTDFLAEEAQA